MYRKQISQKASPSLRSTPNSKDITPSPSYGSLSSVVQRVQQNPNSVSEEERRQLESAIGSRSTREILAGKQASWVPEFKGISAQLWGNAGQVGAPIQAKLTIGEVGDKYEQEADWVAKDVVQRINTPQTIAVQGQNAAQMQADTIQSKETEQEELQLKRESGNEIVQRREAIGGGEASTDLESSINSARGGGQAIAANIRQPMEQAFGADFSGVKIHTDGQSDQLNQSIQARAFTTGQDVFFRRGEYNPGSRGGQELLAHELTHVVQQGPHVAQIHHKQAGVPIQRFPGVVPSAFDQDLTANLRDASGKYSKSTNIPPLDKLIDPTNNGVYQYVITSNNSLIIGSRTRQDRWAHPNLIGGINPQVLAAGEIKFTEGIPFAINNKSGHFQPPTSTLALAEKRIKEQFNSAKLDVYTNDVDLNTLRAPNNTDRASYNEFGNWAPSEELIRKLTEDKGGVSLSPEWLKEVLNDPLHRRINPVAGPTGNLYSLNM